VSFLHLMMFCIHVLMGHRFDVPHDCSVELSPLGYQFFTDIFETFDKVRQISSGDVHKY
jgi:hypothetical protein